MQRNGSPWVLQGVIDAMPDMLRVLDHNRQVVLTNRSYTERFGDQQSKPCFSMFCAKNTCANCITMRAMQTGVAQDKRHTYQGRTYWIKASPFSDSQGNITGAVEVFRDITDMARREKALIEQNKRLLQESNIAAKMQRELFSSIGEIDPRVAVYSRFLPASTISGDLFGCFKREDGKLCFYIADVAGHGIAAAMLSLIIGQTLRAVKIQDEGPAALLARAREVFLEVATDTQQYTTMFVAELEPWSGKLRWANAGHNAVPLLINGGQVQRLYAPSLPICDWADDIVYDEHEDHLNAGGRLLLFTDGLLDPKCGRLTEAELERQTAARGGELLLASLVNQMYDKRTDDVCMFLLERME